MAQQSAASQAEGLGSIDTNTENLAIQDQKKKKKSSPNQTKFDNPGTENTDESKKQKSGSKIPVKSSGKHSNKNANNFATKENTNAKVQAGNCSKTGENCCEIGQNSFKAGHNRNRSEPFVSTEQQNLKRYFKNREDLEKELLEKTRQIESLQKQLNDSTSQDNTPNSDPEGKCPNILSNKILRIVYLFCIFIGKILDKRLE